MAVANSYQVALEVAERVVDLGNLMDSVARGAVPRDDDVPVWQGADLSSGPLSTALLLDMMSGHDERFSRAAHEHLRLAAHACESGVPRASLYYGLMAVAFVVRHAARQRGGYRKAISTLDSRIYPAVEAKARHVTDRSEGPLGFHEFDVISGVTGAGRYLMVDADREEQRVELLRTVLSCLVGIGTRNRIIDGHRVPGWWVDHSPSVNDADPSYENGHLNLGLAHGVAGPLALLSLCWEAGVRVSGQDEVVHQLINLFRRCLVEHDSSLWVCSILSLEDYRGDMRSAASIASRVSWCYGTPGIARAIELAGRAFARPDWKQLADNLFASVDGRDDLHDVVTTMSLCHGLAGLVYARERGRSSPLSSRAEMSNERCVERIIEHAHYDNAFLFLTSSSRAPRRAVNDPGLLCGASGIALALAQHGGAMATPALDAALLLA